MRRTKNNDEFTMPQAVELEGMVVKAILMESNYIDLVSARLKVQHFYDLKCQLIYSACLKLVSESKPIDYQTVSEVLKERKQIEDVGGAYGLVSISDSSSTMANIEFHSLIIIQKYMLRKVIEISHTAIAKANEGMDCFDLLEWNQSELNGVLEGVQTSKVKRIDEIEEEVLKDCFDALKEDKVIGVPVPIAKLRKQVNAWKGGTLIVLAARPAMGKTAVALELATHPAKSGIPVDIYSLEMSAKQLTVRAMSNNSGINSQKLANSTLNTSELDYLRKNRITEGLPLFIDDTAELTINTLRSKAKRRKRENNTGLIIIDYLQLMSGTGEGNREQEISRISRGLKMLAKELDIPIIALSQLSREVEKRSDKKPILSDLRESGAIEQDADMVIFLLRPEYYDMQSYFFGNDEITTRGLLLFIIAKFRGGLTGDVRARWIGETTTVTDWETEPLELPAEEKPIVQNNYDFLSQ